MHRLRVPVVLLATLALALAACTGASPSAGGSSSSSGAESSLTAAVSHSATTRCQLTPDASPITTVQWGFLSQGTATIKAGQTVGFRNPDDGPATVTEGTNGTAAADACIDEQVAGGYSLRVTFYQPGDYDLFCRFVHDMHTVIHVQ